MIRVRPQFWVKGWSPRLHVCHRARPMFVMLCRHQRVLGRDCCSKTSQVMHKQMLKFPTCCSDYAHRRMSLACVVKCGLRPVSLTGSQSTLKTPPTSHSQSNSLEANTTISTSRPQRLKRNVYIPAYETKGIIRPHNQNIPLSTQHLLTSHP